MPTWAVGLTAGGAAFGISLVPGYLLSKHLIKKGREIGSASIRTV
jgi:hypothetical protein